MKCSKCGKEIANDSLFCEYCGTKAKRRNLQVDVRWALLPALLMSTIAIVVFWSEEEHTEDSMILFALLSISSLAVFLLITIWLAIKKRVAYSFFIVMATLSMLNGFLIVDTLDAVSRNKRIYIIETNNQNVENASIVIKYHFSWRILNDVDSMWNHLISKLEDDGVDITDNYNYNESFYHSNTHDFGSFAISIEICFLAFYIIYAFVANKKGWSF